jgi:starch-binding outer membrane protein, SusD/RagB family
MKSKYFYIPAVASLLAISACNKVLDKTNIVRLQPELVFTDSVLTQLNLDALYESNLPGWGGQNTSSTLSGLQPQLSEESFSSATGSNNAILEGTIISGTGEPGDFGTSLSKDNNWGKIRALNVFIAGVETSPLPAYTKSKFIAQARFWRAFRYWDLVRIYGGVPLITTPVDGVGDEAKEAALLPRNTTAECMAQIVTDLDFAINNLPGKWTASTDVGKITSVAAAAMKGRALLYYASPQFNPGDLQSRWQAAYDANLRAKQLADASGYGLNTSYKNMWFTEGNANPEAVMVTMFNTAQGENARKNNGYENGTRPRYLGANGGSNQPSWEMVRSYPMKDGKERGTSTKYVYNDTFFYKNRDPRFDATIAYNGAVWPINGNANYRLWTYYETNTASTEANASNTGFYLRKAVVEGAVDINFIGTDWMEIRYAEILLNLAESAVGINRLATTEEAYTGIIATRKRAGIEAGTGADAGLYGLTSGLSRADLFTAVLNEKKIEFAFEGKRFWDLRRHKIFESTLNGWYRNRLRIQLKPAGGIVPSAAQLKNPSAATFRDVQDLDYMYANFFTFNINNDPKTKVTATFLDAKPINWQPSYYFFPIPRAALLNNPNLAQNKDWGGAFDPLQ